MRLLNDPTEADFDDLNAHPAGRSLAQWLLTLPAYAGDYPDDESPS